MNYLVFTLIDTPAIVKIRPWENLDDLKKDPTFISFHETLPEAKEARKKLIKK
jgi:hypothetical protein